MTDLERLQAWLETYPRAGELTSYQVDYTDQLPGCFGVFPAGMVEVERTENLLGQVTVQNQYNFALYVVFAKAPGDTEGAQINADWVMDFQQWVQEQSVLRKAPTFGNIDQHRERLRAENGALYDAELTGTAMYMVRLPATFWKHYEME